MKTLRQNEDTGVWEKIHEGIVVGLSTTHAKIYNPLPGNGDTVPEYAEWFAIDSGRSRVVHTG